MDNRPDFIVDPFAPKYRILYAKAALKNFIKLKDQRLRDRITSSIDKLALNPFPKHCKKLKEFKNIWEIPVGSYRIRYEPRCAMGEIEIVWFGHHQDDFGKPNFMKHIA
mgnify:CR=1 FL=1